MRLRSECSAERPWLEGCLAGRGPGAACVVCTPGCCLGHVASDENRRFRSRSAGCARPCEWRGRSDGISAGGVPGVSAGRHARRLTSSSADALAGPNRPLAGRAYPSNLLRKGRIPSEVRRRSRCRRGSRGARPHSVAQTTTRRTAKAGYPSRIARDRAYFSRRRASCSSEMSGQPA